MSSNLTISTRQIEDLRVLLRMVEKQIPIAQKLYLENRIQKDLNL